MSATFMSGSLNSILANWYPDRETTDWVLGTVYKTEGSCYRKPGAMMMFSSDGRQLGLLSGGCLEGDIQRHAKIVIDSGHCKTLTYDSTDDDDLSFQLGIGCGGIVHILLQPVTADNNFLALDTLYHAITTHQSGVYYQKVAAGADAPAARFESAPANSQAQWSMNRKATLVQRDGDTWLETQVYPEPHLLIVGGGYDARPMAMMAKQMSWSVSVWDSRPANARRAYFSQADNILSGPISELTTFAAEHNVTAVILMSHSVTFDADGLKALHQLPLAYIGVLGPVHRKEQVIERSTIKLSDMPCNLSGPIGLDIGGETPESIALSVLAEIHAVICDRSSGTLNNKVSK